MNNISLSICIATRNRGTFIGATLESIICQANERVEIVVLDGASTDNTEDVVRGYEAVCPRLRYFRQSTNMGVDHDFNEAVSLAEGEYCWLFSDDDLLKPGAIQTVLDAVKGDYELIVANAEVRNADLSDLLEPKRLPLSADRFYSSSESGRLLADVADYLTFIGCVIIKRRLWKAREKEKYFGSCFVHVGVIFQDSLPGNAVAIAQPLISIRYGNAMWLGRYFEIWMFKWPGLIWSFTNYSDSIKLQICPKEPWRKISTLLHYRAKGAYTRNEYRQWLEPRLESHWARAVSELIACLPGRLVNLLAFIYYSLRRPSTLGILLVDLANSRFCFWRLRKLHLGSRGHQPDTISVRARFLRRPRLGPTSSNE